MNLIVLRLLLHSSCLQGYYSNAVGHELASARPAAAAAQKPASCYAAADELEP